MDSHQKEKHLTKRKTEEEERINSYMHTLEITTYQMLKKKISQESVCLLLNLIVFQ